MRYGRSGFLIACCLVWVGCGESTMVRSYPPGARLYVNGQFAGLTPVIYTVDSSQFSKSDFPMRLDRTGYSSVDGTLRKQTCPGRVTGGVFTLGILFIFKGPTCFSSPQDFSLEPLPGETATDAGAVHQPTIDERLDRIRKMRDQGIITNEEYEHYRKEILKDL